MNGEEPVSDDELVLAVRGLRAEGLAPKEIARALSVRPAVVAPLVRMIAAERATAKTEPALHGCWVSPGWREGLTVTGHPEWPDGEAAPDHETGGLVGVLLARESNNQKVSVCGYLLDVWCLGVKNALGPQRMSRGELPAFRRAYYSPWGSSGVETPIELARELVLGAAEYARTLGFAPHADFEPARDHLGPWTGPAAIGFGRNGMPFYADGPYDDPARVLRTLEESVGSGNFHFAVSVGPRDGISIT
ncbi:MAG: hypothetical protein ACLPUT_07070 [Solirubrobacteraceae bacterium]|jgi:hypothetical protein